MGVRLWHFVRGADGTVQRVPATRVERFWRGEGALPTFQPGEVHEVQVVVHVDGHSLHRFLEAWFPRYRVHADGLLDEEHQQHALGLSAQMISWQSTESGVVNLAPRIAKREYLAEHTWEPTPAVLHELARILNRAADSPPVVAVSPAGLVPV